MINVWRKLIVRLRQFLRVDDGVAAVEFALILTPMLLLYVGTMEASTLISMDRRLQSVAGTVGDLVAQSNETITATLLTDYFRAASGIMTPFPAGDIRQIVTQVDVKADGTGTVAWSKQYVNGVYANGTDYLPNSSYKLPDAMVNISKGQSVIVAKATYSYLPLYGIVIDKPLQLARENFFIPRFGGTITVN
ncbi:TadE/TadG family type IV pilus assembly protein [Devosia psychrophila]|uniref:Flp pilus assembly protein TadG n=1 Tax=Devosia psychrophila TaxID=728005 RepID=A0A1I1MB64_9HYPH|nr:TadE/TadG family type IV pilus assembly protein [Devosia psychrophila]SFC82631.1 Flp pilus assembly protein TadG [Devosia psychrophila]